MSSSLIQLDVKDPDALVEFGHNAERQGLHGFLPSNSQMTIHFLAKRVLFVATDLNSPYVSQNLI